jgi:large exoprotein involved in heme utilization and adhesion
VRAESVAIVEANGIEIGDGGEVILWAQESMDFGGEVSAQGGTNGGEGGFVEVSGLSRLAFTGVVDTSAPQGTTGTVLLDPSNLFIVDNTTTPPSLGDGILAATEDPGDQSIGANVIASLLDSTNVVLQATDGIFLQTDLTLNSPHQLTLQAPLIRNYFGQNLGQKSITQTGGGNLVAEAIATPASPTGIFSFQGGGLRTVLSNGETGVAGNIRIQASDRVELLDGAVLSSSTFGTGNSGTIQVKTNGDVILQGENSQGLGSAILSQVETGAIGNSGNIQVEAASLLLQDSAVLSVSTAGRGNAGVVDIQTSGSILLAGESSQPRQGRLGSGIQSEVLPGANGNAGGINITAGSLTVQEGAGINSNTFAQGDAGLIDITTTGDVILQGQDSEGLRTNIASLVIPGAVGNSGGIQITANSVSVLNGAGIGASTLGQGNAGAVNIQATESITLSGQFTPVNSQNPFLALEGVRANQGFASGIQSTVEPSALGNANTIALSAQNLTLLDRSGITAETFGTGNAGAIQIQARDAVTLGQDTLVSVGIVSSEATGDSRGIQIEANTLTLQEGALLNTSTAGTGDAGAIVITTTGGVSLQGESSQGTGSSILSRVDPSARGNSGEIRISSEFLTLQNGAAISASTSGRGNGGAIAITTTGEVSLQGASSQRSQGRVSSRIVSVVGQGAEGNSGDIRIVADALTLRQGGSINANTFGQGNAGAIDVTVTGPIFLEGQDREGLRTNISSLVVPGAAGNSGDIEITAGSLTLENGAAVTSSTFGVGDAGSLSIKTTGDITFHGKFVPIPIISPFAFLQGERGSQGFGSGVTSTVEPGATGNANTISLTAANITLNDRATILAETFSSGNAGSIQVQTEGEVLLGQDTFVSAGIVLANAEGNSEGIRITADSLSLQDGAVLNTSTAGTGNAGAIEIQTTGSVSLQGEGSRGLGSSILSRVDPGASGNSGKIRITADALTLENGAVVSASTSGVGNGGDIEIFTSGSIAVSGESSQTNQNQGRVSSRIASVVGQGAAGDSGIIRIQAGSVFLQDGAGINANTFGIGNAGEIDIQTLNSIVLQGQDREGLRTSISSLVIPGAEGDSGGIRLTTDSLLILNGGAITASTFGIGNAGPIDIRASGDVTFQGEFIPRPPTSPFAFLQGQRGNQGFGSGLTSTVEPGATGNADTISLTATNLKLSDKAAILAETFSSGDAGSLILNIAETIEVGQGTILFVQTNAAGKPGNIEITSPQITIASGAQISATVAETSTNLQGGSNITLNTNELNISGELGIFAETNSVAPAGDLQLQPTAQSPNLTILFEKDGFISASTTASGNGGSISLTAPQSINLAGSGRVAVSTSGTGRAGEIQLISPRIALLEGVTVSGSTSSSGQGGTIVIQARDSLNLDNATIEALTTEGSTGNGGDIFIDPITTTLHNSRITLDSAGTGTGGNLQLTSNFLHLDRSEISASTAGSDGGSLTLNVPQLLTLRDNSVISTQAGTAGSGGNGGNITINGKLIVGSGNSDIIANAFEGNGGNINIVTQGLFGFTIENTDTPRTNSTSDITASSQFGVSSTPNISQAIDPAQSLAVLDTNVADLTSQIDRRCDLAYAPNASRFVILGKGGLPATARDLLSYTPLFTDLELANPISLDRSVPASTQTFAPTTAEFRSSPNPKDQRVETLETLRDI